MDNYICKLTLIAGLNPKKQKQNWEFISAMGEIMSPSNMDGLGYTAVDTKGNLFGERWLYNKEAFEQRKEKFTKPKKIDKARTLALKEMLSEFMDMEDESETEPVEKYGTFGNLNPEITAVTLHTRLASNTVNYSNVHPFVDLDKSVSVVHNGLIQNHEKVDEIRSTCDSERILNQYIDHEINTNPADMQNFIDSLKGWFACGVFSKARDGKRILDIFKSGGQLSAAYVKELDTVVYSTQLQDIKMACKYLGFTIQSKTERVKDDMLLRLDAMTGEKLLSLKYKDTTKYDNNHSSTRWERDTNEEFWKQRAREKAEEERKKTLIITPPVMALVPDLMEDERPTETQTQETAELIKSGVSQDEIDTMDRERKIQSIMQRGFTREETTRYVIKRKAIDELMTRGWSEDQAREMVEKRMMTTLVTKDVQTSKDIIAKTTDKLMENLAAADDYYMESGTWIKRVNSKH